MALLGPNGAGKTTLLRAVSGLLPRSGTIRFAGKDMAGASPRDTVQAGLVHVVEGHRVFTQLSVFDNLLLAGYGMQRDERATQVEEALAFFPGDRRQAEGPRRSRCRAASSRCWRWRRAWCAGRVF